MCTLTVRETVHKRAVGINATAQHFEKKCAASSSFKPKPAIKLNYHSHYTLSLTMEGEAGEAPQKSRKSMHSYIETQEKTYYQLLSLQPSVCFFLLP
jgi:hypothetical protein